MATKQLNDASFATVLYAALASDDYAPLVGSTNGQRKALVKPLLDSAVAAAPKTTDTVTDASGIFGSSPFPTLTVLLTSLDARLDNLDQTVGAKLDTTSAPTAALPLAGVKDVSADATLLTTDGRKLVRLIGTTATVTLPASLSALGDYLVLVNQLTTDVTISAGSNGINRSGTNSFTMSPDEVKFLFYGSATAPKWSTEFRDFVSLAANSYEAANAAGTAIESRTDRRPVSLGSNNVSGDGLLGETYVPWPCKISATGGPFPAKVQLTNRGGSGSTCTLQITKNGAGINGFTSAVTTAVGGTQVTSTETFATGDLIKLLATGTSGLVADADGRKPVFAHLCLTRTAE